MTARTALLVILGSSPMVEGIPARLGTNHCLRETMYDRTPCYMPITDDQHYWSYGRCARCRKNQAGANLNCDELHDDLQHYVC
jgi:hypothetical protein